MNKKWITLLLPLLLCFTTAAQQQQIEQIASHLQTDRISLHYDCTYTQEAPIKLTGTLLIQGGCYQAKGNGVEIYCNGQTRWTVDPESKEVYIETAEGLAELLAYRESLSELKLADIRYLPLSEDLSDFIFDTAALDASWVVTDLR